RGSNYTILLVPRRRPMETNATPALSPDPPPQVPRWHALVKELLLMADQITRRFLRRFRLLYPHLRSLLLQEQEDWIQEATLKRGVGMAQQFELLEGEDRRQYAARAVWNRMKDLGRGTCRRWPLHSVREPDEDDAFTHRLDGPPPARPWKGRKE